MRDICGTLFDNTGQLIVVRPEFKVTVTAELYTALSDPNMCPQTKFGIPISNARETIFLDLRAEVKPSGGGGGALIFSSYVGSDPASTVHPKKKSGILRTSKKYLKF